MAQIHSGDRISAFDCDILRSAFKKSVIKGGIPKDRWQSHALLLARELTDRDDIDPAMLDWIVRK